MAFYYDPVTKTLAESNFDNENLQVSISTSPFVDPVKVRDLIFPRRVKPSLITQDDTKNIETILRAGQENGVEEMEVDLDKEVLQGIDVGGLEKTLGVSIKIGQQEKMRYRLKIKYKKET